MQFRVKSFVSLLLALAFILVVVSGLILYAGPSGRAAAWSSWSLLGVNKKSWGDLHIIISFLLVIVALWHWGLNWPLFWQYLKSKAAGMKLRLELPAAVMVFAIVIAGTLMQVPPFTSLLAAGKSIKEVWSSQMPTPPIAKSLHSEKYRLDELAEEMHLPVEKILAILRQDGFAVPDMDATLEEIAKANDVSPARLFASIEK